MTARLKSIRIGWLVLILILAALVRILWVLYTPALPVSDFEFYNQITHRILKGEGMGTAFVGPGYPFSLAAIYYVFGDSLESAKFFNVVLGIITCLLTYYVAKLCFNESIAILSAGIIAFLPSSVIYSGLLASENLFTPLLLLGSSLFLFGLHAKVAPWFWLVCSGVMLGLASLVRPIALLVPALFLVYLLFTRVMIWKALLTSFVVGMVALVTISPWLIQNYRLSGRVVIQTEGGITLLIGNHPLANGRYVGEIPAIWQQEIQRLGLNEFQADQLAYNQALQFIQEQPVRWLSLIPLKWFHLLKRDDSGVYWSFQSTFKTYPPLIKPALIVFSDAYYYVTILCAIAGIAWMKHSGISLKAYLFPLLFIIYWLFFHAIFFGMDRFHIPLMPFIVIFSALGVTNIRKIWIVRHSLPQIPDRQPSL